MSPDELTEVVWECRDKWNRPWSIFRRMWDFKTHMSSVTRLALYLAYNPLYAKESYKKQGMLFGRDRNGPPAAARESEAADSPGRPGKLASSTLPGQGD
jgi:hypothetical protein